MPRSYPAIRSRHIWRDGNVSLLECLENAPPQMTQVHSMSHHDYGLIAYCVLNEAGEMGVDKCGHSTTHRLLGLHILERRILATILRVISELLASVALQK